MLGEMAPEVQFVSLGTIGRSKDTNRSNYENCGSVGAYSDTDNADPSKGGFWVPLKFYNNYLTSGAGSALNTNSSLVKALTCLASNQNSGTYLAAPLKAAARFSLGLTGSDTTNWNVNSELNGASRSGRIRTVVIFETDGQPYEVTPSANPKCGSPQPDRPRSRAAATATTCSPRPTGTRRARGPRTRPRRPAPAPAGRRRTPNSGSCPTRYPTATPSCPNGEVLGTSGSFVNKCWRQQTGSSYNTQTECQNGGFTWGKPTGTGSNACWQNTATWYTIGYKTTVNTRTTTATRSLVGGQDACTNFADVAESFKAYDEDTLLITVSFGLGDNAYCSGENRIGNYNGTKPGTNTTTTTGSTTTPGTAYLSDILNTSGSSVAGTCKAERQRHGRVPLRLQRVHAASRTSRSSTPATTRRAGRSTSTTSATAR